MTNQFSLFTPLNLALLVQFEGARSLDSILFTEAFDVISLLLSYYYEHIKKLKVTFH